MNPTPTLDDLRRHYAARESLPGAEQRILAGVRTSTARPRRRWRRLAAGVGVVAVVTGIGTATASVWMPQSVREGFSWNAPGAYNPDLSTVRAVLTTTGPDGKPLSLWTAKAKWTPDSVLFGRGLCFAVVTGSSEPSSASGKSALLAGGCGRISDSQLRTTGYLAGGAATSPATWGRDVGVYRVPGATRARIEFADGRSGEYLVADGWAVLPIDDRSGYPATVVGLDTYGAEISRSTVKNPFPNLP